MKKQTLTTHNYLKLDEQNGDGIYSGSDEANSIDANVKIKSWQGVGFVNTCHTQGDVPVGENAIWMNTRWGNFYARGELYANTDKRVYHEGNLPIKVYSYGDTETYIGDGKVWRTLGVHYCVKWMDAPSYSIDTQGTVIAIPYNEGWGTVLHICPHTGIISKRQITNNNFYDDWHKIATTDTTQLQQEVEINHFEDMLNQDLQLLEQDLKFMSIENTFIKEMNAFNVNRLNDNSYNLLLRIIKYKNYNSKDEFLDIINIYFDNKKITEKQKNELIELLYN